MTETFKELLDTTWVDSIAKNGELIKATIIDIGKDVVTLDAHLKSEGYISLNEFFDDSGEIEIQVGDEVEVVLENLENGYGETILSREKAKKLISWQNLTSAHENSEVIRGLVTSRVKGGFTVEIGKVRAFLPGSLVDFRNTKESQDLEGQELDFKIIKMDVKRNNIVVSRRAAISSELSADQRLSLEKLQEGDVVTGVIKNLTDYGAFIDLGGIDGLLHITDISWQRIKHPSDLLKLGQEVNVKVLKFDKDKKRVSLGMKQLNDDPWENLIADFPVGATFKGKVTNITDYGCFVDIDGKAEGLVHMSEMDWTNKNIHPSKIVNLGDEVDVKVLDINNDRRRISLGMKQCISNPWDSYASSHSKGEKIKGTIKSITDFGLFVGLDGNIDGLVHLSDISWNDSGENDIRQYKKGEEIEAVILIIDPERERVSLGIKQLKPEPFGQYIADHPKGTIVVGKVTEVQAKLVQIELADEVIGQIKSSELSSESVDDARMSINVDDEIEAKIVNIDRKGKVIILSVKAKDMAEEKEALEQYKKQEGDVDGPKLGDIIKEHIQDNDEQE